MRSESFVRQYIVHFVTFRHLSGNSSFSTENCSTKFSKPILTLLHHIRQIIFYERHEFSSFSEVIQRNMTKVSHFEIDFKQTNEFF